MDCSFAGPVSHLRGTAGRQVMRVEPPRGAAARGHGTEVLRDAHMSDDQRGKNIRLGLLLAAVAVFFFLYALFKFRLA